MPESITDDHLRELEALAEKHLNQGIPIGPNGSSNRMVALIRLAHSVPALLHEIAMSRQSEACEGRPSPDGLVSEVREALAKATPGPWEEEWRQIAGQPDYEVSDHGHIRSWRALTRKAGANRRASSPHILKASNSRKDRRGYLSVCLPNSEGRYVRASIHRLVMSTFVGECPDGYEVAHLNGDPADNRLANLKYVTHSENESHKVAHGTRATGEDVNGSKLLGWQVAEVRYLASKGVSQARIAGLFGLSSGHVSNIVCGVIWPETLARDTASPEWLAALCERVERLEDLASERRSEIVRLTQDRDEWESSAGDAEARAEKAEAALRDLADHGTRHDLNPTMPGGNEGMTHLLRYIERMDQAVRARARAALDGE